MTRKKSCVCACFDFNHVLSVINSNSVASKCIYTTSHFLVIKCSRVCLRACFLFFSNSKTNFNGSRGGGSCRGAGGNVCFPKEAGQALAGTKLL